MIALAAVVGAVAMAAAAGLTWWSQPFDDSLTGRIDAEASGAAALPELVPVALVVLAGLGATLATRGVARRLVGLLLAAAGLLVVVRSVVALSTPPAALAGQLVRPADAAAPATGHPVGPLLALLGALAVTAAGVLVLLGRGAGRRRALGARYERHRPTAGSGSAADAGPAAGSAALAAPATGGAAATDQPAGAADDGSPGSAAGDVDARTVDWWNQLDAGADPTAARSVDAPGAQSPGRARSEPDDPARPSQDSTERELG